MEISFQNMSIVDLRSFPFMCASDLWLRPTCSCLAMDILPISGRKAISVSIDFVRYVYCFPRSRIFCGPEDKSAMEKKRMGGRSY